MGRLTSTPREGDKELCDIQVMSVYTLRCPYIGFLIPNESLLGQLLKLHLDSLTLATGSPIGSKTSHWIRYHDPLVQFFHCGPRELSQIL